MTLVHSHITDVPDWPKPGVTFKDITPLLASPEGFAQAIEAIADSAPRDVDFVVGMEARGFIFAAPVALRLGAGFVPVRKPGKLPREVVSESFALEYGTATLTMHVDAMFKGARVLVVDDVLATGGTVAATAALLQRLGAQLVHVSVLLELSALGGRDKLASVGVESCSAVVMQ
ncbi:adenine phosphoribosyltransferase [Arachnia propionica]|uniref:Adenine phosphoribosyltransferase n=1 Tax=Arachnia propionica TaxID=1750 RepID=A0A3P1TE86_9ACTN|nr:adenine phosphoribosyltransferase [Arachnia propionica]RRD07216.1 adenine phosphoribosyltransferase [Arachnia propionica]